MSIDDEAVNHLPYSDRPQSMFTNNNNTYNLTPNLSCVSPRIYQNEFRTAWQWLWVCYIWISITKIWYFIKTDESQMWLTISKLDNAGFHLPNKRLKRVVERQTHIWWFLPVREKQKQTWHVTNTLAYLINHF